jgi:hypothetical protein
MSNEKELADVIFYTRKIESILKDKFEVEGNGLHSYIDSIEVVLDTQLVKNLRYVATIRNKYMHEDGFRLHNINSYNKVAKKCIVDLNDISTEELSNKTESKKQIKTNIKKYPRNKIKKVSKIDNNTNIKEVVSPKTYIQIKKSMIKWIILIILMVAYIINNELNYFNFHTKQEVVETKEVIRHREPIHSKQEVVETKEVIRHREPIHSNTNSRKKSNFSCDGRIYCSKMSSCEEATFYINNCPNTKMDGDGDGIPCRRQWCH